MGLGNGRKPSSRKWLKINGINSDHTKLKEKETLSLNR